MIKNTFLNVLSHIYPIRLKKYQSSISGQVEINLVDGQKTLDTLGSNYSFGSLQSILYQGLKAINFDERYKSIMLLGLGGGSVIQTIRKNFGSKAPIKAIELDPEMIKIASEDFGVNNYENVKIIQADAYDYVLNNNEKFDLIIVDLFIIDKIPTQFLTIDFITQIVNRLKSNGKMIFNTMENTLKLAELKKLENQFLSFADIEVKILYKVEDTNNLLIISKIIP